MSRPRGTTLAALAAATVLSLAAPRAPLAQAAQTGVSAEIATTALTISQLLNLDFGAVVPGVAATVNARTSPAAGQFVIHGNRNAEIQVAMTLPAQLSTGFWTMPIAFGPTSGCWRRRSGQNACTEWDPNTVLVERIRNNNPPNNHFYVWIGGTVTPAAAQHSGMYLGTITLSVAYTGN